MYQSTKELSFSEPMYSLETAQLTNNGTIGFLDSLQPECEDYETDTAIVNAALEEGWYESIVNAYKMESYEKYSLFR